MLKTSSAHCNGRKNMKACFIVGFCARQMLRIVGYQIEIRRIFSLTRILTNLRKCHLQFKKLDKLIFVNKNHNNDILHFALNNSQKIR